MASATENRFVNLYINGKQVGQTYQEMQRHAAKLRAEIARGALTQEELLAKMGKLGQVTAKLDAYRSAQRELTNELKTQAGSLGRLNGQISAQSARLKTLNPQTEEYKRTLSTLNSLERDRDKIVEREAKVAAVYKTTAGSVARLKVEQTQLTKKIENSRIGSEKYQRASKKLAEVNAVLERHKNQINGVNKSWGLLKSVMMGVVGGNVILGLFQKITSFLPNMISQNAKLADSFADVRKTTGLTGEGVDDLNSRLRAFDTRTPRSRLLELSRDAGKLGIEGVGNIEGFVRAADQIEVSLGEDLGEGAIRQLGKLNNLFKVSDVFGYEQGLLKIGSVINELGAGSEASEGAVVDFLSRTSAAAIQAGISLENVAGMGALLDSLGQQVETSGTAVSQAIIGMGKNTEAFAKVAGMSVQEFTELLNKDANEAFIAFLTGLNGNNDGLAEFSKRFDELGMDGARAISILGSLAGNTEKLRQQQTLANKAFSEGTSLTDEFNIKNQNAAANLEKIGRAINKIWINSSLLAVINSVTSGLARMVAVPVSRNLEEQRMRFNGLMVAIQDTSISEEQRLTLMKQLQESYGDRLKNIDLETAGQEDLARAMASVNQQYIIEIALQTQKEKIQELTAKAGERMANQLNEQVDAGMALTRANEALGTSYGTIDEALEAVRKTAKFKYDQDLKRTIAMNEEAVQLRLLGEAQGNVASRNNSMAKTTAELNEAQARQADIVQQLKKDYPELGDIIDQVNAKVNGTATGAPAPVATEEPVGTANIPQVVDEKALEDAARKYEQLIGKIKSEQEKLAVAQLDGRAKEEEEVRLHYEKLREEAEGHAAELATIAELEREALRQIDQKYGSEYDNSRREAQLEIANSLLSENELKLQAETDYWEELIATAREYGLEYEQLEEAHQKAIGELKKKQLEARSEEQRKAAEDERTMYLQSAGIIIGAIKDVAAIQGKNAKFQANMAMFQQFINAGLALSNAAASAKGLTPIDYLAGLATVTVAIIARINQARQMREEAGDAPRPEFEKGTMNYSGSYITGDQGRELHRGAQVIPADITQQILASNNFSRTMPQPNFSAINDGLSYTAGRQAQDSSVSGGGGQSANIDLSPLLAELKALRQGMRDQKVVLSQHDKTRFDDRYDQNSKRVRMGR